MIEALVKHGRQPDPNNITVDRLMVMAVGAVSHCVREMKRTKNQAQKDSFMENTFGFISAIPPEYQVCAVKSSLNQEDIKSEGMVRYKNFMKVFSSIKEIFDKK
jgi:hypothetical protein